MGMHPSSTSWSWTGDVSEEAAGDRCSVNVSAMSSICNLALPPGLRQPDSTAEAIAELELAMDQHSRLMSGCAMG